MDTKICRICGKLSENYVHIFKTEGLKNKIETCLPIIVSPHCLLPDTICSQCLENVDNFYSFIKNCLQNIIVLEAQYDIMESCLKTKRKHEKSCFTECITMRYDKNVQTDEDFTDLLLNREDNFNQQNALHFNFLEMEKLSAALLNAENILNGRDSLISATNKNINLSYALVSYDIDSDLESEPDEMNAGQVVLMPKKKKAADDRKDHLINEITQRKHLKRKCDDLPLSNRSKLLKIDGSRRKNRQPKKLEAKNCDYTEEDKLAVMQQVEKEINSAFPQLCLLCDLQFSGASTLAAHIYEMHGIDMAQVVSSEPVLERKKKLPNLVKITDLKKPEQDVGKEETLSTTLCPVCLTVVTNRTELFVHLRSNHQKYAALMCGLCLHIATTFGDLASHLETCRSQHELASKYICKICSYHDDNSQTVENHVPVHDFVLEFCKRQLKMFDPCDYVEINKKVDHVKTLTCTDCDQGGFVTFKEFSMHRRVQHQIFHCDLCTKFYGRNSHLWKHVNRVHKGHPSITCQLCHKTSASKYHLAQHFNKIHTVKAAKQRSDVDGFVDFRPKQEVPRVDEILDSVSDDDCDAEKMKTEIKCEMLDCSDFELYVNEIDDVPEKKKAEASAPLPKEIDSTSDLYTNIITNYTPPQNEGEYKCPKCFKGFHKKTLLKKHKKNCRPRLQKDLLTRCKTCCRIFKDRQSLTKHLINYHSEYTCEICGQKVQSKCEIVSHIRFSHPNCHLFCYCGNILRSKTDLAEHKSDHRNSFVCQFCADLLPTKIKLKMHILSLHRKILSLSCGICLKLFETQHILRDHVRLVHKDELSPLTSCTVCGKNYGSKWKTYDHLNKSHGRIFKACKSCLEVFDDEQQLQKHFETIHVNAPTKTVVQASANSAQVYDSDIDHGQEENYDKQSTSDGSNDAKTFNTSEEDDMVTTNFPELSLDRLSLLEKRLMGNKKSPDEEASIPGVFTSGNLQIKKKSDAKPKKLKPHSAKSETDQNPLQNSSKRMVYVNSNDPSLCEICLKMWPAKKHLWQHYIRCHKTVAATVCGICLKTNEDYKSLQAHLLENHPTLLHGQGFGSNFICRICGRYHNASSKLKLHMAIHESFDWTILDDDSRKEKPNNGYPENGFAMVKSESINFESLIEQVECSSDSEANSTSDDSDGDESTILHDMLRVKEEYSSSESESNDSSSDTDSDLIKTTDDSSQFSRSSKSPPAASNGTLGLARRSDELDSAIRSISYEPVDEVREPLADDICDVHPQILNQHEIQSAVDSIL
ncbi:hypothetical protein PPYR_14955 [Photinus pyralis]|uniref:C2H2-type domain-containing protein n=2 Tax=Photinus pyralis TaxID=7054 RepID=A0A5N4A0S9_PHOPY|nr:zinc finger protein 423-like [Photinus pyralis]KAB0790868.1 hypothetical protein PPYR_14955 [Photinus pyralis]